MHHYNPDLHHRRSMRLYEYDYSQAGAYFVTVCTQNRDFLFGEITDGRMVPNDAGRMVERWWIELMNKFPSIETDEYVIMPNHFHGIIMIVGATLRGRPDESDNHTNKKNGNHIGLPLRVNNQTIRRHEQHTLGDIIDWFKTMVTNEYIREIKQFGWPPFPGKLWQRNYYEHIIRKEEELDRLREYIVNNPAQWALDDENPDCDTVGAGPCACPENGKPQEKGQPRGVAPTMGVLQYAPTKR